MRNLKRALSLALAAVMVIGMMVVGAGAVSYNDFTDKDEIQNADAVGMVTELGIINGLPNGTYGPTQNIDRASFVKMVALTFNGGSEPMLPDGNKVSYVDTATNWASAYIEYCTNLGFVAGDGTTGKFNPTNPVTVSQAAKMLLVALGYNADVEQYVGAQWQINVDADANTAGLYDGLSGNTSANLTRDNAAQMIYNALDSSMMKYEGVYDLTTGTMKPQRAELNKTLLEAKFGAMKIEGVVVANEYASALSAGLTKEGVTTLRYISTNTDTGKSDVVVTVGIKASTTADLLGRTVTAYVKNPKGGTYQTVYGTPIINGDNTIVTVDSSFTDKDALAKALKDGGITSVKSATVVKNCAASAALDDSAATAMSELFAQTGNGVEITVIDNILDENFIIINHMTPGIVAAYNTKGNDGDGYVTVTSLKSGSAGFTGKTFDEVKGYEDLAKDDIVLFYELDGNYYVEKAESVNVTPTATKGNGTVRVGSDSYKASDLSDMFNSDKDPAKKLTEVVSLGDEAAFYLDNSGYVVYVDTVTEPDQYMFITGADASVKSGFLSLTVKGILSDGTTVTADVNKLNNKSLSKAFAEIDSDGTLTAGTIEGYLTTTGAMVTYSVVSGNTYNIAEVKSSGVKSINQVKKNVPKLSTLNDTIANSNTLFLIGDKDDNFKAYTGIANVPTVKNPVGGTASYHCYAKNGSVASFVVVTNAASTGSSGKSIYVLSNSVTTAKKDGSTIYTVEAVVDGKYNEALVVDATTKPTVPAGYYDDITLNGDGSVASSDVSTPDDTGKLLTYFGNSVISTSAKTLSYDKDTVVVVVDGGDATVDASIDEVIYIGKNEPNNSMIVLVEGAESDGTPNGHADYVFIIR